MRNIPFLKYTSCGNNFVIVDNTQEEILSEQELSYFATKATDVAFGVGCDNLLVLQKANEKSLKMIAQVRSYWPQTPALSHADFIFRMFEPNGDEALCCGNGLACIADYLRLKYNIQSSEIITEVPLATPRVLTIGSHSSQQGGWANLGIPRKVPSTLVSRPHLKKFDGVIDSIELPVNFRHYDLKPYLDVDAFSLKAHLVFTGEPHLVIFAEEGFSEARIGEFLFDTSLDMLGQQREQRSNFGTWLVNRVGHHINDHCRDIFPSGVNVNFARSLDAATLENRCFERGVNKETLACGTGALAVAYVIQQLKAIDIPDVKVLPVKCRMCDPEATMHIHQTPDGWVFRTIPQLLFEGGFRLASYKTPAQIRNQLSRSFAA